MKRFRKSRTPGIGMATKWDMPAPIPWLREEDYARMCEIMVNPHALARNYDEWRELTETRERGLKRQGFRVVRVEINPENFLIWCTGKGFDPNGNALRILAQERVTQPYA